jgi:DNA polymerase alpha subunit B
MMNGSILFSTLINLINVAKAKKAHMLILLGPFIDANHDLISSGNLPNTYEELFQKLIDDLANELQNANIQVIIQPSLNDLTQEPIYPVHPFNMSNQFLKQNEFVHFVQEPCMLKVNDVQFAITSTDIVKDLASTATSKSSSSDKISRNFAHLLRQKSFYPLYPPPDHVCIDYEAWSKYARIDTPPSVFIASSDLTTFDKEVNSCHCVNPGRLVKGTSTGTYAQIVISSGPKPVAAVAMDTTPATPVSTNPATQTKLSDELSFIEQYAMAAAAVTKPVVAMDTTTQASTQSTTQQTQQTQPASNGLNITVTFHKI